MRQFSALFMIALVLGTNAVSVSNTFNAKQSIIADIQDKNSQFYELLEEGSQYVVDEVLDLLKNLEDSARKDLSDLNEAWVKQKAALEKVLASATAAYDKQVKECNRLEAQQHKLEKRIAEDEQEVKDNNKQIKEDTKLIKQDKKDRCASNNAYIDHIIDHKDAILLFGVLRKAIEGYSSQCEGGNDVPETRPECDKSNAARYNASDVKCSNYKKENDPESDSYIYPSFVGLDQFKANVQTLGDYINIFASQHSAEFSSIMSELRQIGVRTDTKPSGGNDKDTSDVDYDFESDKVNATTGIKGDYTKDEVNTNDRGGNKYKDNDKKKITLDKLDQNTVKSLCAVKTQLLKVLNNITTVENNKQKTLEKEETKSNEAAAAYKSRLQDEQRKLARRNETLAKQIASNKVKLAAKIVEVKECRKQEATLLKAKNLAKKNLVDATETYNKRKSTLEGEIKLFSKLYVYYKERVYDVATTADRKRVQDYANNKNFNKTASYTKKEAAQYNDLQGNVDKHTTKEATEQVDGANF